MYSPAVSGRRYSSAATRKSLSDRKMGAFWVDQNIKMKEQIDGVMTEIPTDAFGEIDFKGATRKAKSKYLRFSDETDPELVFKLMTKHWHLPKPRLLISVTGGAKKLNLDPKLEQIFECGLLKVAQTPGAWVVTGGTNTGVMRHVGEALQGITPACIGISTWGIIQVK